MKTFLLTYWASLLVAIVIIFLSFMPGTGLPKVSIAGADKWVHGLMYLGFAGVLSLNLWQGRVAKKRLIPLALLIPIALGGVIEVAQPFFPLRSCELTDWLADIAGTGIGFLCVWFLWIRTRLHTK